jgi:LysR family transcriptional regulator for metE and metH
VSQANVLVQMVAAGQGVTVLPSWAVSHYEEQGLVVTRGLTEQGIIRQLYGAYRSEDIKDENLLAFLQLASKRFIQL